MSNLPSSDSPQVQLMYELFRGLETKDLGLMAKTLHKDCRYIPYPRSLGLPERSREEWLEHLEQTFHLWTDPKASYIGYHSNTLRFI